MARTKRVWPAQPFTVAVRNAADRVELASVINFKRKADRRMFLRSVSKLLAEMADDGLKRGAKQ